MKKIYLFLILLFFSFINVYALEECTTDKMKNLRELANNVEFKYEYEMFEFEDIEADTSGVMITDVKYRLKILNDSDDLEYILRIDDGDTEYTKEEFLQMEFVSGSKVKIIINAFTPNLCSGELLKVKTIEFPLYNMFYKTSECKNYPDFKYCQEFMDTSLVTNEKFQDELKKYINNDESSSKNNENNSNNNVSILKNNSFYYVTGGILILVVIMMIIILLTKRRREDI